MLHISVEMDYIIRLIVALILGGIIGGERETVKRPAGFRTYILVCVGSALVMITSEYILNRYVDMRNLDPTRMGAQVISGIGFLGAGTIIREHHKVRGLTTAAGLWTVACVGIAVGAGYYTGAIAATVIIIIILILFNKFKLKIFKDKLYIMSIDIETSSQNLELLTKKVDETDIELVQVIFSRCEDGIETFSITLSMSFESEINDMIVKLYNISRVKKVKVKEVK